MAVPDVHFHDISMIFCRHPSRFCGQNSPNFVIAELPKKNCYDLFMIVYLGVMTSCQMYLNKEK
jgi:hypothetical protein